jgi:hypothetical protein
MQTIGEHEMSVATTIEHGLYRVLNPVMKTVLRSPLHRMASRTIALLRFRGRTSGREFVTPLSYVRDDQTVWFLSAHSTNWWKNFREGDVPVSIEIARKTVNGTARLWDGDTDELREHVSRYLCALPRDAKIYGIKLDQNKVPIEASLVKAAPTLVMVQVELE